MKLREICITEFQGKISIVPAEYSDEEFYDTPGYSIWEQALAIANESGLHISRNKDLLLVAVDEAGVVQGAVWSSLERDDDQDANVFDFDVAVDPKSRGPAKIGPQLIDAALEEFENLRSELDRVYVRVWVINPKLAHWLEYRRGFEPESTHPDGSAHMVYYGINESAEYAGLEDADEFQDPDEPECPACGGFLAGCEVCGDTWCDMGCPSIFTGDNPSKYSEPCSACGATTCGDCGNWYSVSGRPSFMCERCGIHFPKHQQ